MKNLAEKQERLFAVEEYGQVTGSEGGHYHVETGLEILEARRAVTCLIEPQKGDKVLVCSGADDRTYILAILERPGESGFEINVGGDLTVSSPEGSVNLRARNTIGLVSEKSVEMLAPRLNGSFKTAQILFNNLLYAGQAIEATVSRMKVVAQVAESVVDRLQQVLKNSYRTIEESEYVRAGSVHYLTRKLMALRSRYTVITAKKDVKIDGKHIHMG